LNLSARENLGFRDGSVGDDEASRLAVVCLLRKFRPKLVFTHHPDDSSGHPDHRACNRIVEHAVYLSGLAKIDTGQERHRPDAVVLFNLPPSCFPSFIVDVSGVYDARRRALSAYRSQFHDPQSAEPQTYLSHPRFLDRLESTHRYFGALIAAEYGEPFWCERPVKISDPTQHFVRGI
jgi:LmbE family N-acetylglucosaminyl deacetylase